jgi:hypothetical protein
VIASPRERLLAVLAECATSAVDRPIAVGWATVDLDRAAAELVGGLDLRPEAFTAVDDSVALGARCRVAHGALPGEVAVVLLEPATEGRLAATLARHDEGPAAVWIAAPASPADTDPSDATAGPFGPERLLPGPGAPGTGNPISRLILRPSPGTIRP